MFVVVPGMGFAQASRVLDACLEADTTIVGEVTDGVLFERPLAENPVG